MNHKVYARKTTLTLQDDKENIVTFINKIGQQMTINIHEVYMLDLFEYFI